MRADVTASVPMRCTQCNVCALTHARTRSTRAHTHTQHTRTHTHTTKTHVIHTHACMHYRACLVQVNFHTTQVGEAMVTLVYHKKLNDVWQEAARKLRTLLAQAPSTRGHIPHVIGEGGACRVPCRMYHKALFGAAVGVMPVHVGAERAACGPEQRGEPRTALLGRMAAVLKGSEGGARKGLAAVGCLGGGRHKAAQRVGVPLPQPGMYGPGRHA